MAWGEVSIMGRRSEFIRRALKPGANRRKLCREFEISAKTGYKWLARWQSGDQDLSDRSRRPHKSPGRSASRLEAQIVRIRDAHPAWGPRKIGKCLERKGVAPPALSTIAAILRRHGRSSAPVPPKQNDEPLCRFEKEEPNLLWQMDFKGWVSLLDETRCHPLTILDDHSRYSLCLKACDNQQTETVRGHLETAFREHGLPLALYVDNGSPWGDPLGQGWTRLGVWLIKLGIELVHSRPFHPQARGKNERFHRTLNEEVLARQRFSDLVRVQRAFDRWREIYNYQRPHDAIGLEVPAKRWHRSLRRMPGKLPEVDYAQGEIVRTVSTTKGYVSFKGQLWRVPQAFCGERVAIRPIDEDDGCFGVFFADRQIAVIVRD